MSTTSQSLAPFDVVLVVSGDRKTIHCESYQEAVKRAAHERTYWAGDPDVMVYIEPGF